MRANLYAALYACVLAAFVAGPAKAGDYVTGYGWYRGACCYRAPVLYGPPQVWVEAIPYEAYDAPPLVYYAPVERHRVVRFSEFSYSGLDAYAAADEPDDACDLIPLADWRGGWVWTMRAGCF
jgi:hypothetical protein